MTTDKLYRQLDICLQNDAVPSLYINSMSSMLVEYPFDMLQKLKETEQSPKYHPEGNVWVHTMMVVDEAARVRANSADPRAFMWAALLHDIGKPDTTRIRKGRITSYDHDKVGARLSEKFLRVFGEDEEFIRCVRALVRYHMQILFVANNMPLADIRGMLRDTDVTEVALLGLCDRIGRLNSDREKEERNVSRFLEKCRFSVR